MSKLLINTLFYQSLSNKESFIYCVEVSDKREIMIQATVKHFIILSFMRNEVLIINDLLDWSIFYLNSSLFLIDLNLFLLIDKFKHIFKILEFIKGLVSKSIDRFTINWVSELRIIIIIWMSREYFLKNQNVPILILLSLYVGFICNQSNSKKTFNEI